MRKIVYYVAASLDGFIAGPDEDISGFIQGGEGVEQYQADLQHYDAVLMGRKTYEFGYRYGLEPGQPAYGHMTHYIFSNSLRFDVAHEQVKVSPLDLDFIRDLKRRDGKAIYLCGGGELAGRLLEQGLIDEIKIKLNPLVLGRGVPLFANLKRQYNLEFVQSVSFPSGMQTLTYTVKSL